jgi:DNA polymerase I
MNWQALPFEEIWLIDFEFHQRPGERPEPICLVAHEMRSDRRLRLWHDELSDRPPFAVDGRNLFVAYSANAELGCFLALGWPMPARVLDLYVEFRARTNGDEKQERGLLAALSFHGIPAITKEEKLAGRAFAIRGGPFSDYEKKILLAYCETDVGPLGELLTRMLPTISKRPEGLGQALLRGRYMAAVAHMGHTGVPVDAEFLSRLRDVWPDLKLSFVQSFDKDFRVYDGTTFKVERFAAWLDEHAIDWPRLKPTDALKLDKDTFKEQARTHPILAPLRELRRTLNDLRLEKLAIGADGRNRVSLMPFGARTGRNTPTTSGFIFGLAHWLRHLVRPETGRVLACIDWTTQEIVIAAALSGDQALIHAVQSGDPYLSFAKLAGLAPADATKRSHGAVRELCKQCLLGTNYGMTAKGLANRTQSNLVTAEYLLDTLARTFPRFKRWSEEQVDIATLRGEISTVFGWPLWLQPKIKPRSLLNYPMQANAAEMMRIACCLATERGVRVCAPIHDAFLVEAEEAAEAETLELVQGAMREASRAVLDGQEVGSEAYVVRWPGRYADDKGAAMWARVNELLAGDRNFARVH